MSPKAKIPRGLAAALATHCAFASLFAQAPQSPPAELQLPPLVLTPAPAPTSATLRIINIWPEGVPGTQPDIGPETNVKGSIGRVSVPTLTAYTPSPGKSNGTGVIICPGGAYSHLSSLNEGSSPARWLNGLGVTAFVLKYRLAEWGHPAPLQDVLRSVRLVRSRAAEFGVRSDRIGVLGFSAGGHLAACAGTLFDDPDGRTGAPIDQVSARPDFLVLIYPVITMEFPLTHKVSRLSLLGKAPTTELVHKMSVQYDVTAQTPPSFLVTTEQDTAVPADNSILFFQALKRSGVPAELHVFERGPHGYGLKPGFGATSDWPKRCEDWLRLHDFIP